MAKNKVAPFSDTVYVSNDHHIIVVVVVVVVVVMVMFVIVVILSVLFQRQFCIDC